MSHKRHGDIANFFQRGLPAHARDSCLRPQEARPSSESPVAPTPVLEEVTNRMDATLRESAGGAEPGSVKEALPATGGAVPEPIVRVFSRKRPAATAAAAPPGHGLPSAVRARSTHTGDAAAACDKPSVPPTAASTPAGRAKLKQLHLDVGQRDFGHATCAECGMVFARGDPGDERAHASFHAATLDAPTFRGWQQERVVWRAAGCATTRVVHVAPGDASSHWSSARQLGSIVSTALGLPDDWLLPPCAPAAGAKASMSPSSPHTADGAPIHVLLYVTSTHRVGGVVVGHPLRAAHRVCPPSATAGAGGGILCCAEHAEAAACGVRAIWVHPSHRRKGVATALLDGLRGAVVGGGTGVLVPRELLAFSQPTPQGRALAERYTRTTQFLVYT